MGELEGWLQITEVPGDIGGQRAELVHILINKADRVSRSGRQWRFKFSDTGGWSNIVHLKTQDIVPSRVAALLAEEAYSKETYEAAMMEALRKLVGPAASHAKAGASHV